MVAKLRYLHLKGIKPLILQTQDLRVGQVNEPCIGLTQENSIENSVQCYSTRVWTDFGLGLGLEP